MKPRGAKNALLKRLRRDRDSLPSLSPAEGIEVMFSFYAGERAEGCILEEDGDMLLYQWGTYDWGEGESFELDITRQFIDGEHEIRQLSLTFKFTPSDQLSALGSGNRWCPSPDDMDAFRDYILASAAYALVQSLRPSSVTLELNQT